jgi:energy-coupling factor transporter ATP-binding protein EcfA2
MGSEYDVFLSHKGDDKAEVELLGARLKGEAGLRPFLDKWHLVPGESWQAELEHAVDCSASAAIFFGPHGTGPWHTEEIQILLDKAARTRDDFRVIPVLLPGASADTVSVFLKQRTWVDFRSGLDNQSAFQRLVAGIKGEVVEPDGYQLPDEPAPYRGLERFEARQKDYFFGRDSDIRRLAKGLVDSRFVAIIGASGCGKSSLVRAGLHADFVSTESPDFRNWQFVTFLPGSDPFRAMAEQLAPALPVAERIALVDNLAQRFEARKDGLRTAIDVLFPDSSRTILIVVDQFEEIFTHLRIASDPAGPSSVRAERWIANLVDAIEESDGRIRVLITLRADFISQCLEFPHLRSLLENNQLLLGELGTEALREAVKFPARRAGAFFENGLVEVILRDVHQQRGSLPMLQHALKELWQARRGPWLTLEAYEKSGGVSGALRRRADYTYTAKLKDDLHREVARNIFIRLTNLGEGVDDSRRRVPREELFPYGIKPSVVEEVLAALSHKDARLIVVNHDGSVEVTHEALIHTWDTLRDWIDADREQLRLHRRLTDSAREWDDDGRDASYLYRGGRLEDVEEWPTSACVSLNATELAFVTASIAERQREWGERELQQRRELEAAQKLARAETKRAQEAEQRAKEQKEAGAKLRLRAVAAIGAAIAALILLEGVMNFDGRWS